MFPFSEEQEIYQDILQENFVDSYNNLTLKSILTLKYYAGLKKDKLLLLKTDDDSYVHIGQFIRNFYFSSHQTSPKPFSAIPKAKFPGKNVSKIYMQLSHFTTVGFLGYHNTTRIIYICVISPKVT